MKKEPNEVDREAARLFSMMRGMSWAEHGDGTWWTANPRDFNGDGFKYIVSALDTDDGPTKGAMLDQIRADQDDPHVSVQWNDGQWCVCAGPVGQFSEFLGTGSTEGAALVDAKKAKGDEQ